MIHGARTSVLSALVVIVAGLTIAACGSSSSTTASAAGTGTSTGTSTTPAGGHGFAALTSAQRSCLSKHGVTLPSGHFGGGHFGGGTGTFTRPAGGFPPPGGTSTNGQFPHPGGFFGGGGAGGGSKFAAAFKACGVSFGDGFRGRPGGAGAFKPTASEVSAFVGCVDEHGYDLPAKDVNTSGTGSILPKSLETNKKFLAAAQQCLSDLRPAGAPGGAPGSGTSTGSSST